MQIGVARSRKTTFLFGVIVTSVLLQILHAKDVSFEDGNQEHQPQSTLPLANTKHIVELGNIEARSKYRSTNPRDVIQEDNNQQDSSLLRTSNVDQKVKPAHSTVDNLFKHKKSISENRDKTGRSYRPSIDESFQILRRVLRELGGDDLQNNKHSTNAGTQGNNGWRVGSTGLDITSSVVPRTSTVEPKETVDVNVNATRNLHGLTNVEVAVREKRSKNCPKSPEGEKPCIPCQDENLSMTYEHTDTNNNTCICDYCWSPQYMEGPCVCTPDGGDVSCKFPIKGRTYMSFPNKCNRPFECTQCPGNMTILNECETDRDSVCGCADGYYQTGESTCKEIPRCQKHFVLSRVHHSDDAYPSYTCICNDEAECGEFLSTTERSATELTDNQSGTTLASGIAAVSITDETIQSSSENGEESHHSPGHPEVPNPTYPFQTSKTALENEDSILNKDSQIIHIVAFLVVLVLLVLIPVTIFASKRLQKRKAPNGQAVVNDRDSVILVRYERCANREDSLDGNVQLEEHV